MAKFKDGVMFSGMRITNGKPRKVEGVSDEIHMAIAMWDALMSVEIGDQGTVTSLADGTHSKKSKHYGTYRLNKGKMGWWCDAVDLRTRYLSKNQQMDCAQKMRNGLGKDFDVVLENTHLHIEYDPKK